MHKETLDIWLTVIKNKENGLIFFPDCRKWHTAKGDGNSGLEINSREFLQKRSFISGFRRERARERERERKSRPPLDDSFSYTLPD